MTKSMVFDFSHHLKKNFAKKNIGAAMLGTIAIRAVADFYKDKKISTWEIEGFVKFNKLFVKTINHGFGIQLYRDQQELLAFVNKRLDTLGYQHKLTKVFLAK